MRRLIEGGVHSRFIFGGMAESAKDAINLVNDSSDENTDEDADEQEEINDSDEIECL